MSSRPRHMEYKPRTTYRDVLRPEEKKPKKLCSVYPGPLMLVHTTGHYNVPGPAEGERYGFVLVGPSHETDDLGECRTLSVLGISARRTARDIIGLSDPAYDEITKQLIVRGIETSQWFERGLFVPEGDDPTEEELVAAEKRRDKWLAEALAKGDRAWNTTRDYKAIPGDALIAARFLNADREWSGSLRARPKSEFVEGGCPACGAELIRGKKVCAGPGGHLIGWTEDAEPYWRDDPDRKAAIVAEKLGQKKPAQPEA